ncbi:MAG: adenylate/guanylate cyclase domain-containing protein [Anaerolineae bacterium]
MSTDRETNINLRHRLALLNIIADFNLRFSSTLAPSAIERLLFEAVEQVTGAHGCILLDDKQHLSCRTHCPEGDFRDNEGEPLSGCPAVQVLHSKSRFIWSKGQANAGDLPPCRARPEGIDSFIGLPLLAGDRVIGAVGANYLQMPESIEQHADLLAAMLAPAGMAFRNSLLHQQLSEEKERVAQLEATLHRLFTTYMPQQVADVLLANPEQAQPGGQRCQVTVLFLDMEGFTTMAERRPPEEVVTLLNSFLAIMVEQVSLYGGTLDKFLGDGVMALFNAPLLQEDHPWRAVQAALAMRDQIAGRQAPAPMRVNIGLHTGEAIVGNVGSQRLLNYTAIGDTVNVAFRLQEMAHGGKVLISEPVYRQVKGRVQVEFLGEQQVAGRQEPVKVYQVS